MVHQGGFVAVFAQQGRRLQVARRPIQGRVWFVQQAHGQMWVGTTASRAQQGHILNQVKQLRVAPVLQANTARV
jgi:hypothetical protein